MKTNPPACVSTRNLIRLHSQLAALLWLALALPATATSLQLNFTVPSSFNESNRQAALEWNAEPARTYLVQSTTNLSSATEWKTEEAVRAASSGPVKWTAPEALSSQKFYRLILPQPEVFAVEPSFINSEDPAALFYLIGQMLPTNGSVVINGQNFTVASFDPDGSWVALSLNGLPPGTPILDNILVLDNSSNIVTTLPIQNPVLYGTALTTEQLQGPPDEPPASPSQVFKTKTKSNQSNDRWAGGDSDADADGWDFFSSQGNRGAVIQFDVVNAKSPVLRSQGGSTVGGGGFPGAPQPASKQGKSTQVTRSNISNNRSAGTPRCSRCSLEHYGRCNIANNRSAVGDGGVSVGSGELQFEEVDLALPGRGLDFAWTRTYRSRAETTTAQGAGWDFSFNVSATPQPDGTVVLRPGNGRADTFYPNGTNGWTRDEYFLVIHDVDQDGSPDEVIFPDTGKWLLHPPGTAFAGKLAQIVDRNGNAIRCDYDPDTGRLLQVVDTLDRTNTVAYNSKGFIESVTDFSGRTVRYEYDSAADLVACISPAVVGTPNGNDFPGGKTNRYAYSTGNLDQRLNHNLLSITDPKGQVCLEVTYHATNDPAALDFDAVSSVLRGIEKKDIRRGMVIARPGNSFATIQAIVNDYVGNVTEYLFDSRHRCVSVREFTGRANPALPTTATENRPTGKLRAADPDYFETRWEWNADSLCTRELRPDGGSTEISHQRAQDHNSSRSNKSSSRAHDGNVRVVRERASSAVDTDGDGATDTTELTWHFEYDPRFGSPAELSSLAIGIPDEPQGTFALGDRIRGQCFVTTTTDPRGTTSTAEYNAQGNRVKVKFPSLPGGQVDFSFNAHGQLTAITNAADANGNRSVDAFSYYTGGAQRGLVEVMMAIGLSGGLSLTTAFEYDPRGNVTRIVDPRGNDRLFTYNALDQCMTRQTQQASFGERVKSVFYYDANNNLVRRDLENRDETGALVATNPQWTTLFEHDALDRLTGIVAEISEGGGLPGSYATNRFVYDANDNLIEARSPLAVSGADPHNTVAFGYDERDLLYREVAAPGSSVQSTTQCDYDVNGNLIRVSEGLESTPSVTTIEYDGFAAKELKKGDRLSLVGFGSFSVSRSRALDADKLGSHPNSEMRVSKITDPLGNITTFHHDRNSNLKVVRHFGETNDVPGSAGNRLLGESRYEYDSLDRLVRSRVSFFDIFTEVSIGDGRSDTTYNYAPNGACTSVTDDNSHITRFTYDSLGRLAAVTDPKTNVVQFAYDACGNLTNVVSSERSEVNQALQQFRTAHTYDALNRCVSSVDNVGNTNRFAYDSRGNLVSAQDPQANEIFVVFDGLGRCVASTNYVGAERGITINTSHVEYDTNSRRTATTDSNGNTTTYAYDSLDRCIVVTEADGTSSSLVWSPRSNLLRQQDANGTVITNVYDLLDRCVARVITPGPTVAPTTTFETFAYDGFSRIVAASNDVSASTFAYDSLGNCVRQIQDGLQTTATFDAVGNTLSQTYPGGRVVAYSYDALDQVASLSSGTGGLPPTLLAQYAYEGPGRVGRVTRANGVSTRVQWNGLVNPPNASGDFGWQQISRVTHATVPGNVLVDQRTLQHDRNQNTISRARTPGTIVAGETITLGYDALDRLTNFVRVSGSPDDVVRNYVLDGNGNRQVVRSNGVVQTYVMDNTVPVPADFQMNQYTLTPFGTREYDENGNLVAHLTAVGPTFYQYDYADRLVQVNGINGEGFLGPIASYSYDALGRRIRKVVNPGPTQTVIQSVVSGDDEVLEERENGTLRRTFAQPHVFEQKGRIMFTDTGGTLYSHEDDLGNVLALTDASGAVVERYEYDEFGLPRFFNSDGFPLATNSSPAGNPFLFHGLEWDADIAFYHGTSGDFYDPQTARVINGGMPNRISMNVTVPKQTQGATFGEKVNQGLHAAGGALAGKLINPIAMDKGLRLVGSGGPASTKAQDHNSSRSNKSGLANPGGGGGGGSKAQDHNSSRSNKSSSLFDFGGGGGGVLKQLRYTAKAGKTGSASGK
jgi:YD repeat-containing protein